MHFSIRATCFPLKGDGAPKDANLIARALRHAGASRRATRASVATLLARRKGFARAGAIAQQKNAPHPRAKRAHAHLRRLSAAGPAFSADLMPASVSQLLAGTPSGPGGSSDAVRVLRCDETRGRRTPSRYLTSPHDAPLNWTKWGQSKRHAARGDKPGINSSPFSGGGMDSFDAGFAR